LHAEKALWDALDSASKKAAAETVPRKTFTFVDLTGKETLPVWLPQAVLTAGRSHDPSALGFDSSPQEVRLLMTALCAAATAPRAFTSLGQWHAAWRRYAPVAVCTGQLSWRSAAQHEEVIDRLFEDERAAGRNPLIALVYDEVARLEWARRASRSDPSFDLEVLTLKRDDLLLEAARSRLATATVSRPGAATVAAASVDSAIAKQEEAAAAFARRANEASKQLAKSQESLARQQQAAATAVAGASSGGGEQYLSRKDRKSNGKGKKGDKGGKGGKGAKSHQQSDGGWWGGRGAKDW